jgi:predicted O-methyltransferase YrrM
MNQWLKDQCNRAFLNNSDINQHIPVLYFLANQCDHVTELGVRTGTSSTAFLYSNATLRSYDIEITGQAAELFKTAKELGKDAELYCQNSLSITNFEETDLLFIDTFHSYTQAIQELTLYHSKVRKWIVLHDTELFGTVAEDRSQGLNFAIDEFLSTHHDWQRAVVYTNNNGLTILNRK